MRSLLLAMLMSPAAWAAGDFTFDGADTTCDRVQVTNAALRITGAITVAAAWWGTNADGGRIAARSFSDNDDNYNLRYNVTGTANWRSSSGAVGAAGYLVTSSSTTASDGARHSYTVVYDAADARGYYDGVLEATDSTVATPDNPVFAFAIGASGNGAGGFGSGDAELNIDWAIVHNVALAAGEVTQLGHPNSFRRPFRNRVGYWCMMGKPGTAFGGAGTVSDWSPTKANADGDDGSTDPTYLPGLTRGAGR